MGNINYNKKGTGLEHPSPFPSIKKVYFGMKYEQEIFNPPRISQANTLYEAKITELQIKIKSIYCFAGQLKANGLTDCYNKQIKEANRQEEKLSQLIMTPEALIIPWGMFHG